eukprot:4613966-Alexandrium_andersonii.AAC.1
MFRPKVDKLTSKAEKSTSQVEQLFELPRGLGRNIDLGYLISRLCDVHADFAAGWHAQRCGGQLGPTGPVATK